MVIVSKGFAGLRLTVVALVFAALSGVCGAADVYVDVAAADLKLVDSDWPTTKMMDSDAWRADRLHANNLSLFMQPYAVLDGPGEAIVSDDSRNRWMPHGAVANYLSMTRVAMRLPESGAATKGRFYFPAPDWETMLRVDFAVPKPSADPAKAREAFLLAKERRYRRLMEIGGPGTAWFRHERDAARRERLGADADKPTTDPSQMSPWDFRRSRRGGDLEETFNLFSGGRALSENLQLDRDLRFRGNGAADAEPVALDAVEGISIAAIDWKPLLVGKTVVRDTLAASIPADQHALFFPSFDALMRLIDESKANGTPILRLLEDRSEDAQTAKRYERQLCLSPDALSRILGPKLVKTIAMTGSDPYLRTGSDLAVLFEAADAMALKGAIAARQAAAKAANPAAEVIRGTVAGLDYVGAVSPDRAVCSYLASRENVVIVTNSLAQLERLAAAMTGKAPNLGDLDEYAFFRDRYKIGDADETALLVLSDDTIRRWCGPRWRIASSRRTRVSGALAELQARNLDALARGDLKTAKVDLPPPVPDGGALEITPSGARSSVYGSLDFLTPIIEIPIQQVRRDEADAYDFFRRNYQENWRRFFDPIAVRFSARPDGAGIDMTVRPLIAGSEYRELMQLTGNAAIAPDAGDPHADALLHFVMSLDRDSPPVKSVSSFAMNMAPGIQANALQWLGGWLSIYADADPLWIELGEIARNRDNRDVEKFIEKKGFQLPIVVHIDVSNAFALTAFLASVRAFIEQTAPGMTLWENKTHGSAAYVRIGPSAQSQATMPENMRDMALFYAPTAKALILSLSEPALKRALDRSAAGAPAASATGTATAPSAPAPAMGEWLGKSLAARVNREAISILQALFRQQLAAALEHRSWSNTLILNEWRRRFGANPSPADFHERWWQTRLVCPGGGDYVWNEAYQTYESTVFGHPGQPRPQADATKFLPPMNDASFGLTFEGDGLRARARIGRP